MLGSAANTLHHLYIALHYIFRLKLNYTCRNALQYRTIAVKSLYELYINDQEGKNHLSQYQLTKLIKETFTSVSVENGPRNGGKRTKIYAGLLSHINKENIPDHSYSVFKTNHRAPIEHQTDNRQTILCEHDTHIPDTPEIETPCSEWLPDPPRSPPKAKPKRSWDIE